MKKTFVFVSALLALLGTASPAQTGQIPVVVKQMVLFENGDLNEYITSEYDPSYEKLTSQGRYSASNALLEKTQFSYADTNGRLTTKITFDTQNKEKNRVEYEYDSQGRLIREAIINKNQKVVSSYDYTYDAKGNRSSRIMNSGASQRMAETRYTYNDAGKVISSETLDAGGTKVISSIKNTYDRDGNLVKQEVFSASGQSSSVITVVWKNGLEMSNEQSGSDGKVQVRITSEYGSNRELLKREINNLQGDSKEIIQYEYELRK